MQERSSTLPMCSVDRSTYMPSTMNTTNNQPSDSQSAATQHVHETGNISSDSSTSTPELNLLLDKLTEILRFRSGCRRHSGGFQPTPSQPATAAPSSGSTSNLKRLQSSSIEPLHHSPDLPANTGAWKSSTTHPKSSLSSRSHHHHHHQTNLSVHIHNLEKKRRLPSLLQRLIDEGNLIKEAVRRLKSQRFSQAFKGPATPVTSNLLHTPSTPTTKVSCTSTQANGSHCSSASMPMSLPSGQISDPPSQSTASPNRGISWFLSSSVFGVNASATTTTNHSSESGSPLRTCYSSSSTHDRTPMEIGIHDG